MLVSSVVVDPDLNPADGHPASDDALARGEGGVDQAWYVATYPDVAAAGMDPVVHYLQFGWREGRDPRRDFSTRRYLADHEDVARSARNPFIHYLRAKSSTHPGEAESTQALSDVELARRKGGVDQQWYLETHPDIAAAGMDPVHHYLQFGWREGRDPRRNFSTRGYLAINREVARAGQNPFIHYLRHGGPKGPPRDVAPSSWPLLSGNLARITEWWDYKLVPIVSIFYATALVEGVSVAAMWPALVALMCAIVPCAAYVSFVNDVTDRGDDRRAGKANRLVDKGPRLLALLFAVPLALGAVFGFLWRDDPPLVAAYLCTWAAFSLYSIPPFRLKGRGILGVVADASGAHLFPSLVAVFLALRAARKPIDPVWIGAVAAWALGCGLRGILWHQLKDIAHDRKAAVRTFVLRHSPRAGIRVAGWVAMPLEAAGLAVIFWWMQSLLPLVFLLLYAAYAALRQRLWAIPVVFAAPRERYSVLGQEYYGLLFPLGILMSSALRHPVDAAVAVAHLLVFPGPAIWLAMQTYWLACDAVHSKR
jgi:hypothetical protein